MHRTDRLEGGWMRKGLMRGVWAMIAAATLLLGACSTTDQRDPTLGWTAEKLYAEAKDEMKSGRYGAAIKLFEKLEARYPFGRWAQQAQIEIAYSHYK